MRRGLTWRAEQRAQLLCPGARAGTAWHRVTLPSLPAGTGSRWPRDGAEQDGCCWGELICFCSFQVKLQKVLEHLSKEVEDMKKCESVTKMKMQECKAGAWFNSSRISLDGIRN